MSRTLRIILSTALAIVFLLFVWYFSNIVFYILTAAVISFVGRPLVHFLDNLRIGRIKVPHAINALLALLVIFALVVSLFAIFVPLIARQASILTTIDTDAIMAGLREPMAFLDSTMHRFSLLRKGEGIEQVIIEKLKSLISIATFTNALNYIVSFTGSFFMAIFSILFISFFFLKDDSLFYDSFMVMIPQKYNPSTIRILNEVKRLLTRYFIGLIIELTSMITLITLGLMILGVENALLIGFIGGLMNVIPYLGPLIGATIGIIIGIISSLALGAYTSILPLSLTIAAVFGAANLVDNILLQPLIYSTSVRAHPIEIFLVIIIAGTLFGVVGMILAVPAFTVIRVILREFFSEMRIVQRLTQNM